MIFKEFKKSQFKLIFLTQTANPRHLYSAILTQTAIKQWLIMVTKALISVNIWLSAKPFWQDKMLVLLYGMYTVHPSSFSHAVHALSWPFCIVLKLLLSTRDIHRTRKWHALGQVQAALTTHYHLSLHSSSQPLVAPHLFAIPTKGSRHMSGWHPVENRGAEGMPNRNSLPLCSIFAN